MGTFSATSAAPPARAWELLAQPARWHEWAPHLRGAWHLGAPEVAAGHTGAVRLLGAIPVPARITAVDPGRYWTWRVGPVTMDHIVEATAAGCLVRIEIHAAAPIERAVDAAYGPLVRVLLGRLARRAEALSGKRG